MIQHHALRRAGGAAGKKDGRTVIFRHEGGRLAISFQEIRRNNRDTQAVGFFNEGRACNDRF